jgi:hypothetical protein
MIRRLIVVCVALVLVIGAGCKEKQAQQEKRPTHPPRLEGIEAGAAVESAVTFDIAPAPSNGGKTEWMATYVSQGKTARFGIELGQGREVGVAGINIQTSEGRLIAQAGSDASVLLIDLKKELQAKKFPAKVKRASSLSFNFAMLGEDQSRSPTGGFTSKPPGDWIAYKLTFEEGDEEGEVYLNLDPAAKKGEFSIKDADFGDFVLAKLATLL